jgi:hypothetical protein
MLKIEEAENYLKQVQSTDALENLHSATIERVEGQVIEWKEKLDEISDQLTSDTSPAFHEIQDCVLNRLASYDCANHQGYVMEGFQLDSEMASYVFLEPGDEGFEFNELTKPDYVILLNRVGDSDKLCGEFEANLEVEGTNEMKEKLQEY